MRTGSSLHLTSLFLLLFVSLGDFTRLLYDGDLYLGSLFPIHKQGQPCGEIQSEDGIQPLEAMLFTLDQINSDSSLLTNITLGAIVYDSCDDPYYASDQSLHFLKGFMTRRMNSSSDKSADKVIGMIGPQTSAVSVQLGNLGRIFKVPQISYLSTSVKFCNSLEFPNFFRTVPSDVHQAKAIAEIFSVFKWNYASIVYSDSEYGEMGYEALKKQLGLRGICLHQPLVIINKYFTSEDYENTIRKLDENKLSRIVIVFCDRVPAGKLLEAAKYLGYTDKFVWVGSDAWASRESVVKGRESTVAGAIAVQPLRRPLPGFNEYFSDLFSQKNSRNPWFTEYLETYCNCTESETSREQLYVHFVRDAVYAFAVALHDLRNDKCGTSSIGLCPNFWTGVYEELVDYVQNVTFKDVVGNDFRFHGDHEQGVQRRHDGPPRYTIINFRKNDKTGEYRWTQIGTYVNGKISLDTLPKYFEEETSCKRSACEAYEIRVPSTVDGCCWTCKECESLEYRKSDYECEACPKGKESLRENNRSKCVDIPEIFMDYTNEWAIVSMGFASIGIIMTFVTSCIFWKYWETPVVKASGRELSLILLLGTFLSFTATFIIVAKPTVWTCGLMRFCIGFCYTVCYAAVVTKTNRVSRIFQQATNNPKCTSPIASLLISGALVLVEVIINIVWLIFEPPGTAYVTSPGKRILVCNVVDKSFMAGLIYPFILILGATMYAFKTRKCPGGFNETRFIFFANTITSIHWFAYVPLYLASTDHHIRAVILAFSLCLSGIVQLGCLLFPKLYTVIFKPEKNTRDAVMTHRSTTSSSRYFPAIPRQSSSFIQDCSIVLDDPGEASPITPPLPQSPAPNPLPLMGIDGRHRTWSHTLHPLNENVCQIPRKRSTSISRSTQTNTELESKRSITFIVNHSDDELEDADFNFKEKNSVSTSTIS